VSIRVFRIGVIFDELSSKPNLKNMRTILFALVVLFSFHSCIPLRIAPKIEDHKITRGKKFKRSLSKRQMFIFENYKNEGHFYNYINAKFQLAHNNVYDDIPFLINGEQHFFAWYEVEIPDKALNLAPMLFNVAMSELLNNDDDEFIDAPEVLRNGNWYLAIEVYSDNEKDCLAENTLSREAVLKYLRALKKEYLATHNYNEVVFKN